MEFGAARRFVGLRRLSRIVKEGEFAPRGDVRMARYALALGVALVLTAFLTAPPLRAQGGGSTKVAKVDKSAPAIPEDLRRMNDLTGTDPTQAALKTLLDDKSLSKKLIAEALPVVETKEKLHYNASLVLALAAADLKDLSASEAFFRNCIDQALKLQSETKLLQSFGGLIDIYYDAKKYDEAARLCKEFIDLKTDDGKERTVLIAYTNRRGETEFYESDSFALKDRLVPIVYRQYVQSIAKQGKHKEALQVLENLIKMQNDWRDRALKGWIYREAGDYPAAAKAYEEVIEKVKGDRQKSSEERSAIVERNEYLLSNIYVEMKQIDKAAEVLQKLLKDHPDDPGYNNDLGYIWADHDMNLDESEKLIRKALEEDKKKKKSDPDATAEELKDNGAYLDSLGWVLFKKKDYKEAKKVLQQAVEDKASQHIEIYDHLGDVLMALNERDAAVAAWKTGLEHMTDSARDQERKKLVEEKIQKAGK
jgi:tetratricopeptide (TPR) repeat protein